MGLFSGLVALLNEAGVYEVDASGSCSSSSLMVPAPGFRPPTLGGHGAGDGEGDSGRIALGANAQDHEMGMFVIEGDYPSWQGCKAMRVAS